MFRESAPFESVGNSERIINEAFEKAKTVIARDEIDPNDFEGVGDITKETIAEDARLVTVQEGEFMARRTPEQERKEKYGLILEAIIDEQIELSEWLGPNTFTRKTSRYDDIVNYVDLLAEIVEEETREAQHLALAIDTTVGQQLQEKTNGIRSEIDSGKLAKVRYAETSDGERLSLQNVPRFVLGIDADQVRALAVLWVADTRESKRKLAEHPVQLQIIDELLLQNETYRDYARAQGQDDIADIYERNRVLLEGIREEKRALVERSDQRYQTSDRVFRALRHAMQTFRQEQGNESTADERAARLDPRERAVIARIRKGL